MLNRFTSSNPIKSTLPLMGLNTNIEDSPLEAFSEYIENQCQGISDVSSAILYLDSLATFFKSDALVSLSSLPPSLACFVPFHSLLIQHFPISRILRLLSSQPKIWHLSKDTNVQKYLDVWYTLCPCSTLYFALEKLHSTSPHEKKVALDAIKRLLLKVRLTEIFNNLMHKSFNETQHLFRGLISIPERLLEKEFPDNTTKNHECSIPTFFQLTTFLQRLCIDLTENFSFHPKLSAVFIDLLCLRGHLSVFLDALLLRFPFIEKEGWSTTFSTLTNSTQRSMIQLSFQRNPPVLIWVPPPCVFMTSLPLLVPLNSSLIHHLVQWHSQHCSLEEALDTWLEHWSLLSVPNVFLTELLLRTAQSLDQFSKSTHHSSRMEWLYTGLTYYLEDPSVRVYGQVFAERLTQLLWVTSPLSFDLDPQDPTVQRLRMTSTLTPSEVPSKSSTSQKPLSVSTSFDLPDALCSSEDEEEDDVEAINKASDTINLPCLVPPWDIVFLRDLIDQLTDQKNPNHRSLLSQLVPLIHATPEFELKLHAKELVSLLFYQFSSYLHENEDEKDDKDTPAYQGIVQLGIRVPEITMSVLYNDLTSSRLSLAQLSDIFVFTQKITFELAFHSPLPNVTLETSLISFPKTQILQNRMASVTSFFLYPLLQKLPKLRELQYSTIGYVLYAAAHVPNYLTFVHDAWNFLLSQLPSCTSVKERKGVLVGFLGPLQVLDKKIVMQEFGELMN
ncbi:hypothetical protein HMI54_007390, partial [Coelomomyces lativittatus]